GDTYNSFEEYLSHIANESVNIDGGDMIEVTGTGTAGDHYVVSIAEGVANSMLITNASGDLEWATIADIVETNETVTTLVNNNDGLFNYTIEASATCVIDVLSSLVNQFEAIYTLFPYTTLFRSGDTYNSFEEYLSHIANESVNIDGGDMIEVTGTGTAGDPYVVSIAEGVANSMLIKIG